MFVTHLILSNKHTDRQHRLTTLFSLPTSTRDLDVLVWETFQRATVEVEKGSQIPGQVVSPTVSYLAKGTKVS